MDEVRGAFTFASHPLITAFLYSQAIVSFRGIALIAKLRHAGNPQGLVHHQCLRFRRFPQAQAVKWIGFVLGHPQAGVPIHMQPARAQRSFPTYTEAESDHQRLLERLYEYGLQEQRMSGDGNCQFRAISDQLYGTPEKHKSVRKHIVQQLKSWKDLYREYVPMKYSDYVRKMKKQGEWGDHVTLQAAADCFGMKICLVTSFKDTRYIEILPKTLRQRNDIFLSFYSEVHYNSLYQAPDPATSQQTPKPKKKHWLF
ncbi:hypothetical protein L7F22_026996 [Adiantum nelumboides]|nr:hypothetical protein [Adiantum nelumboides]